MEIIALILIILFVAVTGKKKPNRPSAGQQPGNVAVPQSREARQARLNELRQRRAAQADAPVMPDNAKATFESSIAELKELLNVTEAVPAEGESMLNDADCHGGSMPHAHSEGSSALDDEDCAGGSMAHAHTEGVSRAAQARRMAAIERDAEASKAAALVPQVIDARELRRAVVMAEVLGKPKGLRKF